MKPDNIPVDVWDEAGHRVAGYIKDGQNSQEHFARAIMNERSRCDLVVTEEWHRHVSTGASAEKMVARILDRIRGVD